MPAAPYIAQPAPPYGDRVVWHVPRGAQLPKGWREVSRTLFWGGAARVYAERVKAKDAATRLAH